MSIEDSREHVKALNQLIQACKKSEQRYLKAVQDVSDAEVQEVLAAYAQQRAQFVAALKAEIRRQGGTPATLLGSSLGGALHRGWLDLRSAIGLDGEHTAIAECLEAEAQAVKAYEFVRRARLPADVLALVLRQHGEIQRAYASLSALSEQSSGFEGTLNA